jgi:hypothetical protein
MFAAAVRSPAGAVPGLRLFAEEALLSRHRQTRIRPGKRRSGDCRPSGTSRIGAVAAVADRGVNRRFRGVIGTVARP